MVKKVYIYIVLLFSFFVIFTLGSGYWYFKKNLTNIKSIVSSYEYGFIIKKNIEDKICLIQHTLNNYYKTLIKNETDKKIAILKNDLVKLTTILKTLQQLGFNNYKSFLFKYIFSIYNEDIEIAQNYKIIISKRLDNIGSFYSPPCNPFKNYGQCVKKTKNKIYVVQYSPAYHLLIESDFKTNEINKNMIIQNILTMLKSIPDIIIYYDSKKIKGDFNDKSFYVFDKFKKLNIFFGFGIKYKDINLLSDAINNNILKSTKSFVTSFLSTFIFFIFFTYMLLFILYKNKIIVIEHIIDDFHQKAHYDKLTGVLNRNGFEKSYDTSLCEYFIIIDMDNFKYINDTFGHKMGDTILKYFASLLQHYFPNSLIGRWGGDEFLICTSMNKEQIKTAIEKISKHLYNYQSTFDHFLDKKLGVSAGACDNINIDFQKRFNNADLALYKVKKSKKGHVVFYEDIDYVKIEREDIK